MAIFASDMFKQAPRRLVPWLARPFLAIALAEIEGKVAKSSLDVGARALVFAHGRARRNVESNRFMSAPGKVQRWKPLIRVLLTKVKGFYALS